MEIEFNELGFHVSIYRNRVHWTRFPCLIHVPSHLTVTWILSWKSSLLDSISVNGPQHSTCCRGFQLGTCFPLCPSHYISDIEYTQYSSHFSSSQYTQFSKCTLNPLYYTHLTQHLRYTILYLLVFFVKKNLEHIRKSYALFIYFFLLV